MHIIIRSSPIMTSHHAEHVLWLDWHVFSSTMQFSHCISLLIIITIIVILCVRGLLCLRLNRKTQIPLTALWFLYILITLEDHRRGPGKIDRESSVVFHGGMSLVSLSNYWHTFDMEIYRHNQCATSLIIIPCSALSVKEEHFASIKSFKEG